MHADFTAGGWEPIKPTLIGTIHALASHPAPHVSPCLWLPCTRAYVVVCFTGLGPGEKEEDLAYQQRPSPTVTSTALP